jgi:hypothetical protein
MTALTTQVIAGRQPLESARLPVTPRSGPALSRR